MFQYRPAQPSTPTKKKKENVYRHTFSLRYMGINWGEGWGAYVRKVLTYPRHCLADFELCWGERGGVVEGGKCPPASINDTQCSGSLSLELPRPLRRNSASPQDRTVYPSSRENRTGTARAKHIYPVSITLGSWLGSGVRAGLQGQDGNLPEDCPNE